MKYTNPLPSILELIPYLDTPLDTALMDEFRIVLAKHTKYNLITDKYIELLIAHLADAKIVAINEVSVQTTKITFIRKLHYGKE